MMLDWLMLMDEYGKCLYMISGGKFIKVKIDGNKKEMISYQAEQFLNYPVERDFMFEHVWRQVREKFYDPDLHGLDWNFYKKEYEKFLPYINNNFDYAEMLSEMLGELNASHTGSGYRFKDEYGDKTAALGIVFDWDYRGEGIKVVAVLDKGPFRQCGFKTEIRTHH